MGVYLHDEIVAILRDAPGHRMTTSQIAARVNERGRYAKNDGSPVTASQIYARTARATYRHLFERDGSTVILRQSDGGAPQRGAKPMSAKPAVPQAESEWFWEGNVQAALARHLEREGWHILRMADTAAGQHGVDILAERDRVRLAVEVKGYPTNYYARGPKQGKPKPTPPALQASHWFAGALHAAMKLVGNRRYGRVAMCLPDVPCYRKLHAQVEVGIAKLGLYVYFVKSGGEVTEIPPPAQNPL